MILIGLSNISLILGSHRVFNELNWNIQNNQKIGLIGPNGAGKSSLFKLIIGEFTSEPGGVITRAKGITLGYLPQQPELDPGLSVYETAMAGNRRWVEVESDLARIEGRLEDPALYEDAKALSRAMEEHQKLVDEYVILVGCGRHPYRRTG